MIKNQINMANNTKDDNNNNKKKLLLEEESVSTEPTNYITRCKNILSESKASKDLTQKILKVVLEMNQELNSKSEQITSMTEAQNNSSNGASDNTTILAKLKEISETLNKKTYAQATSIGPTSKTTTLPAKEKVNEGHILCLYPLTETQKLSLADIKKILLPYLQEHPLNRIKEIRNGGILIELGHKSSISGIAEILKTKMKDEIRIAGDKIKKPQFIIKGISSDYTQREPEELIEQFKKLNGIPIAANIRHKTYLNLKSGDKHWVVETDGPTAKTLKKSEMIYLEFTRHRISENFFIPVCAHCRGIGHSRRFCLKLAKVICHKCGGEHTTSNCEEESTTCWLCHDHTSRNHKAGSDHCQTYINRLKQAVKAVSYE